MPPSPRCFNIAFFRLPSPDASKSAKTSSGDSPFFILSKSLLACVHWNTRRILSGSNTTLAPASPDSMASALPTFTGRPIDWPISFWSSPIARFVPTNAPLPVPEPPRRITKNLSPEASSPCSVAAPEAASSPSSFTKLRKFSKISLLFLKLEKLIVLVP